MWNFTKFTQISCFVFGPIFRKLNFDIGIKSGFGQMIFSNNILPERLTKPHKSKSCFSPFFFLKKKKKKKKKICQAWWAIWKKIPFFRSNNLFFSYYLKVDLYGSLSGQGTDDRKLRITRIKAKMTYFKASKYGKKGKKSENFQTFFQLLNLNNLLQEHFNPELYIFWKYK